MTTHLTPAGGAIRDCFSRAMWVASVIVLFATQLACGQDDESSQERTSPEGDDLRRDLGGVQPSDVEPDLLSEADATPEEPEIGPVTLHFAERYGVRGGAAAFHNPDGSSLGYESTEEDEDTLSVELPAGSWATFVEEDGNRRYLWTIVGLQPGDELLWEPTEDEWSAPETVGNIAITINDEVEHVNNYNFSMGYGGVGSPSVDQVAGGPIYNRDLTSDGTINVLGLASAFEQRFGFATFADVSVVEHGTTELRVDAWRDDWGTLSMSTTNAPPGSVRVGVQYGLMVDHLVYDSASDGGSIAAGESRSHTFDHFVSGFGQRLGTLVEVYYGEEGARSGHTTVTRVESPIPSSLSFDLGEQMLPWVGEVAFNPEDPARPVVTWTSSGDTGRAEVLLIVLCWYWNAYRWTWRVIAPPRQASSFQFPELPQELIHWRLNADADYVDVPWVGYVESDLLSGWDEVRQDIHGAPLFISGFGDLPDNAAHRTSSAGGNLF